MSKMKKPKSIKPPMPIVTPKAALNSQEGDMQFELELCWCVQQMETSLKEGNLSQKVAEDTAKNLKILRGNTAPIIKKRQVMKSAMGDYRAKMKEEEKKMGLAAKQIKFAPPSADAGKKSSFVKKSAILSSGKDFKFDFVTPSSDGNETNLNENLRNGNIAVDPKVDPIEKRTINQLCAEKLNLTSGCAFKFNFHIDELNDQLSLKELSIKN